MSDLAYFEYALVLLEERYLIEVQSRNPSSGETRSSDELQQIATEALTKVVGQGRPHLDAELKPNSIPESEAVSLAKVQQLLTGPDCNVFLVE